MEYKLKNLLTPCLYEDIENIVNNADTEMFRNKTVLITGAGKLTGYYLACSLLICNDTKGYDTKVIVTDREKDLFVKYGSINSRNDIDFVISNFYSNLHHENVDYIIHADTTAGKDYFESMENLLNYCKSASCSNLMICTDMDVYGEVYNKKSSISEDDEGYVDLCSTGGSQVQNIRMAEVFAEVFCAENNISVKFARMAEIFGANGIEFRQADQLNEKDLVDENAIAERFSEFASGEIDVIKSYCYVTDAVCGILKIMSAGEDKEKYNISSNWDTSFKYMAEICEQLFPDMTVNVGGRRNNISNDYSISALSSTRQILDNSKLTKIGYKPEVLLADGIKRTVKIIRENI